jgi:GNAT superfamily N-acetyltransferase
MREPPREAAAVPVARPARPDDAGLIFELIRELADYERLPHEVDATSAMVEAALFGPHPRVFSSIAEYSGESGRRPVAAGFSLWFYNFSTFRGRHGIYLEDLFVRPAFRGRGCGKVLLAELARRCVDEGLARLEWSVLDWNEPSIAFYRAQGGVLLDGWTTCRMTGDALVRLAAG